MSAIATIGHLTRDVVADSDPRPGGGVLYAARALAHLGADARAAASCSPADRDGLLPALAAFGLPVRWYPSRITTAYSFRYEGEHRVMRQDAVGDPWTVEQALEAVGDAAWVHVGALVRTDFSPDTLEALAAGGRRLLVDAHGLVRTAALGPLQADGDVGSALHHISILKLNDEEAVTLVGSAEPERLLALGVPETILTLGSQGAYAVTPRAIERIPAAAVDGDVDPTGAGDTFSAGYLVARARGAEPVEAARVATRAAAELLGERARP